MLESVADEDLAAAVSSLDLGAATWKLIDGLLAGAAQDPVTTGLGELVRRVRARGA